MENDANKSRLRKEYLAEGNQTGKHNCTLIRRGMSMLSKAIVPENPVSEEAQNCIGRISNA